MEKQGIRGSLIVACGVCVLSIAENFLVQWKGPHVVQFSSEATNVARALLHGRGFADPYMTGPSGPTAQMAPLYPFLYAGLCWVFGTAALGWAAIVATTSVAWALEWFFVYKFAVLEGHARAGVIAAVFGTLLPLPGRLFKWEAVFTGLILAASAWMMARILKSDSRIRTLLIFGTLLGAGLLLSPVLLLIWPFWGALIIRRRSALSCVIPLLVALFMVAIWTVRNFETFGHFVLVRDDAGIAFASSNNDCAMPLISENIPSGCYARQHPSGSVAMLNKLLQAGEYQFSADELHRTRRWVYSHPYRFAVLTSERFLYFWFPLDNESHSSLVNGVVLSVLTLLSLFGVLWVESDGFRIIIAMSLPYSLIYYFVQFEQRYRYPIVWSSVLLAAVGIELFIKRKSGTLRIGSATVPKSDRKMIPGSRYCQALTEFMYSKNREINQRFPGDYGVKT